MLFNLIAMVSNRYEISAKAFLCLKYLGHKKGAMDMELQDYSFTTPSGCMRR